jgi:hypothetical protein
MGRVFRARDLKDLGRRTAASLLSASLVLANVPQAGALDSILGTIQVKGPAYAATATTEWTKIAATRPLVAGDRLKTEAGGNLLADLGSRGVVGLYGDSEVAVAQEGEELVVNVLKGKVAFHLEPAGRVKVTTKGAVIPASPLKEVADGYVEFDASGTPQVVVESARLNVALADGSVRTLAGGDRLAVTAVPESAPAQVATGKQDERKAGPVAAGAPAKTTGSRKVLGMGPLAWTAIGGLALAVGVGAGVAAGGGGGGDSNGSN